MKVAIFAFLILRAVIASASTLPPELMAPDQRALLTYIESQHLGVNPTVSYNAPLPLPQIVGFDDPEFQKLIAEGWTFVGYDFECNLFAAKASAVFRRCVVPFRPERKELVGARSRKPAPKLAYSSLKEFYQEFLLPVWGQLWSVQKPATSRTPEMLFQEWLRPPVRIPFREHEPLDGLPFLGNIYRQAPITTSRTR
jgi:hypothetical protein